MPGAIKPPFDADRLDRLMDAAGMDLLAVCSKHAVQYLLGGYRSFFFVQADAIGQSRYLPILLYPKGRPDRAVYIGHRMEKGQQEVEPLWAPDIRNVSGGSADAMRHAVQAIQEMNLCHDGIGVESAFLPVDAARVLTDAFPDSGISDALPVLERLRARKAAREIEKLRKASDGMIASMLAVIHGHGSGATKRELVEALRREEVARGLTFDYCLITAGPA